MNLSFFLETLRLAFTNLRLHKLRSALTSLGIIIGVGAVITMLAIGEGAKQRQLQNVAQLGATNIIMRSVPPSESNRVSSRTSQLLIYGIKRADLEVINEQSQTRVLPNIEQIVPLRETGQDVVRGEIKANAAAVATTPEFLAVANLRLSSGRFLVADDMDNCRAVCVLGAQAAQQLFSAQSPLGQTIKIGSKVFEVVGTIQKVNLAGGKGSALTGRELDNDVYFPLTTNATNFSDMIIKYSSGGRERKVVELTEIYLRVDAIDHVLSTSAALQRLMDVRHSEQRDVNVMAPIELLNQANKTAKAFTIVMGGIAFLSLLIGGIGIMNISLATVTERTREIGIRRALGAKRRHIIDQFLIETTTLSVTGGVFGIGVGIGLALLIRLLAGEDFPTYVTVWSVALSFSISAMVGILFGVYPAIVAAHKDPIEALRHD